MFAGFDGAKKAVRAKGRPRKVVVVFEDEGSDVCCDGLKFVSGSCCRKVRMYGEIE